MKRDHQDSDLNYEMVQKTVQAATAPRVETTGVASVFALGESLRPDEPDADARTGNAEHTQPSRYAVAEQAFRDRGEMTTAMLAQHIGVNLTAAKNLAYNMRKRGLLVLVRQTLDGNVYDLPERQANAPAAVVAEPVPAAGLRVALFNTGELIIECGGRTMQLAQADTRALCDYIDRMAAT